MSDIDKLNRLQLDLLERDRRIRDLEQQLEAVKNAQPRCPLCGVRV